MHHWYLVKYFYFLTLMWPLISSFNILSYVIFFFIFLYNIKLL
jgi:hypothetical protein